MAGRMWGGTRSWMGWMPAPTSGMQKTLQGYSESIDLQNGGISLVRSNASHAVYELNFPVENASKQDGLTVFNKLASGYYGPTPVFFADPMAKESNLFAPNWATPALIEGGDWKNIYPFSEPTFSDVASPPQYDFPRRAATWTLMGGQGLTTMAEQFRHVIPVPPGDVLWIGASGSRTNGGTIFYSTYKNGKIVDVMFSPPGDPNKPLRAGVQISNLHGQIDYVDVRFAKLGVDDPNRPTTITILGMDAKLLTAMSDEFLYPGDELYPSDGLFMRDVNAVPLDVTGRHFAGEGNNGLEFSDNAVVETYIMQDRRLKGLSTRLVEVGSWR